MWRPLRLRRRYAGLFGLAPLVLETVDMALGVRDRCIRIGPGEADLQRRKRKAADDDGPLIRAPDPGVPQAATGLEGFDVIAVVEAYHCTIPAFFAGKRTIGFARAV